MTLSRFGVVVASLCVFGSARAIGQTADPCNTAPQSCATQIQTQATSRTRIPNTAVDVAVGIQATGRDLSTVQRTLAEKAGTLLTYLKAQGAERLITDQFTFEPETKSTKTGPDRTVGYNGSVKVSFRTTPEKAPDVLAGVLEHGANEVDTTNFVPTEAEMAAARRELAGQATKMAIAEAEAIAKAAGLHVVSVREITVGGEEPISPRYSAGAQMNMRAMAAPAPPMPTVAGDQEIAVGVSVGVAAR